MGPDGDFLIKGDCIDVMQSMEEESVDLIYADPPFNSGRNYSDAAGEFGDKWKSMDEYIGFMKPRIEAMRRILRPTGAICIHCNHYASHRIRCLLDGAFGEECFRNEIIWAYSRFTRRTDRFPQMHDAILIYGKGEGMTYNQVETEPRQSAPRRKGWHTVTSKGETCLLVYDAEKAAGKMEKAEAMGRPIKFVDAERKPSLGSVWTDIPFINSQSDERVGYPTQKPLALLERIVAAMSDEGDMVFDPFCGSGTALVAAKRLGRGFMGCDVSEDAIAIAEARLAAQESDLFS